MKILKDVNYSTLKRKECLLDAYLPDLEKFPIFVYIHGGGMVGGDMSRVETLLCHGSHTHYLIVDEDAEEFEFSSIICPFIEKHSK